MKRNSIIGMIAIVCFFSMLQLVFGEVTEQEAQQLKTTLTPMGAEKAGNSDGTIPAWEGGYTTVAPGFKPGDKRPDPFADEKPMFRIDASNLAKHSDKLTEGIQLLLKKYPDYYLDVYPSHRTASAPQYVYDNTFRNATRAKTIDNGLSVVDASGGIPFPIPKTGNEAMFNHLFAWWGAALFQPFRTYIATESGKIILAAEADQWIQAPYYYKDIPVEEWSGDLTVLRQNQTAPAFKAGETILAKDPANMQKGRQAWQYLVGQRRVRRAPSIAYDTPNQVTSGNTYYDEVFIFNGSMDRYNWKLVGKTEMYVPYNCNGFYLAPKDSDVLGPHYAKPDYVRWELHRVWVVEATLAPGKRHVVAKRRFYLDEDTWCALQAEGWDANGQIWRYMFPLPLLAPDVPVVAGKICSIIVHNLQTGSYVADNMMNEMRVQVPVISRKPDAFFTPEALAGSGMR